MERRPAGSRVLKRQRHRVNGSGRMWTALIRLSIGSTGEL
jgi:hypothetical protein